MSTSQLTVSVYVAPMRPFAGAPAQVPGDEPMWSPMSSTLIACATEAILVDTLVTIGQVDALAEWVRGFGKRVTGVYITHGHQDHWIGLARLQQYLRDFSRIVNEQESVEDIVAAMLELHGDRDNPRVLWHSARAAVA